MKTILYCDGGCRANVMGGGVHGYTFPITKEENLIFYKFTPSFGDTGYIHKDDLKEHPDLREVSPHYIHNMALPFRYWKNKHTNNIAELLAIYEGLKEVYENVTELKEVEIITDSMVAIRAFNGLKVKGNNYRSRSSMEPEALGLLESILHELVDADVYLTIKHIAAHSGFYGNEMADTLATNALFNNKRLVAHISDTKEIKKWLSPVIEENKVLKANYIYFRTSFNEDDTFDDNRVYPFITIKNDDWIGRLNPKTDFFGIFYAKKPIMQLNFLMNKLNEIEMDRGSVINIPNLYKPNNKRLIQLFGEDAFFNVFRRNRKDVFVEEGSGGRVANIIEPVGLDIKMNDKLIELEKVYNTYMHNARTYNLIDITEQVYYNGGKVGRIHDSIEYMYEGKKGVKAKIVLHFGNELPSANQLNKAKKPEMYLAIRQVGSKLIVSTLANINDDILIQSSDASNFILG